MLFHLAIKMVISVSVLSVPVKRQGKPWLGRTAHGNMSGVPYGSCCLTSVCAADPKRLIDVEVRKGPWKLGGSHESQMDWTHGVSLGGGNSSALYR